MRRGDARGLHAVSSSTCRLLAYFSLQLNHCFLLSAWMNSRRATADSVAGSCNWLWSMAKVFDFQWQIAVPEALFHGAVFDRVDEVRTTSDSNSALCTVVHCAVKTRIKSYNSSPAGVLAFHNCLVPHFPPPAIAYGADNSSLAFSVAPYVRSIIVTHWRQTAWCSFKC